ncbi:hypothetical protein AX15_002624 [Amanita polypyramis BW_CC]|nr:hypothetical protein AX15_002624 [Amanita polypyramis BW_CC]
MAQSYFAPRVFDAVQPTREKHLKVEDVQDAYIKEKDRIVDGLDATRSILNDMRASNKNEWVIRYPQFRYSQEASPSSESNRRSLSLADDPSSEWDVLIAAPHKSLARSSTLPDVAENEGDAVAPSKDERVIPTDEFSVLRLDLKLGAHTSPSSVASLVTQLEKSSIANLLDARIDAAISHIDKLRSRVEDTSSKVLVTGDLNAGKSTFVNALLRREVMPVEQQPCTTAFYEVHDAAENRGKEEVHVVKEGVAYDVNDESTYTKDTIADLERIVSDNENSQRMIKVYLADTRAPSESLLNNGVVDISLIDSPGLNRDRVKTTAVFARQEEIDVVVFVVSAENHFTLSAEEFLRDASNEKAYLFIVVNKFDQIRNKEKCKRAILEQIRQLSPRTFDDAEDLVHFVDSAAALQPYAVSPTFDDLESALRSFVLEKRSKSKLQPVSTYITNILSDVEVLAAANSIVAEAEIQRARDDLSEMRPVLETMKKGRDILEESLETTEEEGASKSMKRTKEILVNALERVGQGKLGVDRPSMAMPLYTGIYGIWDYVREVRKAMLASLDAAVMLAENEARIITTSGVNRIRALEDEYLPQGVERSKRVFVPEAMFCNMRRGTRGVKGRRPSTVVTGGLHGLGIGLAQRQDMLEATFFDLFDVQHQFAIHSTSGKDTDDDETFGPTTLSIVSVSVGALTMVGGQAIGARGLIEGFVRVTYLFENETARKWAAPVLGAVTVGLTAYLIIELPRSIPRTVGRRIRASVMHEDGGKQETFIDFHVGRVSRETRRVLQLASWEVRRTFGGTMENQEKAVFGAEEQERKGLTASGWFTDILKRVKEIILNRGP